MAHENLEKEFKMYAELARKDKSIDVASLMAAALEKSATNKLPAGKKRWAYLISIGFPPFGLIYAVKYWFSDKDDGRDTAWMCIVLTCVSLMLLVIMGKILLSGPTGSSTDTINQIKSISPKDIQQLTQ